MELETSLERFLRTGKLASLSLGLSVQEIEDLIGKPDATGGTSSKHKSPTVYKYGNLELFFDRSKPQICQGIYLESCEGLTKFQLPATLDSQNWILKPFASYEQVLSYLSEFALSYRTISGDNGLPTRVILHLS